MNIIAGITSLLQHLHRYKHDPDSYKPSKCPHCGSCWLWNHGCYTRKSDRSTGSTSTLNPIPIPRFYCADCQQTFSTLPECIPPRRWYLWDIQETVLQRCLAGESATEISQTQAPGRRTIGRWLKWLQERYHEYSSVLTSRFSVLGYGGEYRTFWQGCFEHLGLSRAMIFLHHQDHAVP